VNERVLRLYRASLRILPREVRDEDGPAIVATLEDQLADASTEMARTRIWLRAFVRLPGAAVGMARDARGVRGSRGGDHNGGGDGMYGIIRALRIAVRTLTKAPAFTWASVLLLALGIGAGTAAFSIVDHVLLRPLPYPQSDRLVYMTNGSHSGPTLRRLDTVESFDAWAAASGATLNLVRPDAEPVRLRGAEVTASFFSIFAATPVVGRLLVEADETGWDVVVLTHQAWERLWGADPAIVGSTIDLAGRSVEVVGVLEEGFVPPQALTDRRVDVFYPMNWGNTNLENPGYHAHSVVARLAPGASLEQGDADLVRVASDVMAAHAEHFAEYDEPVRWPLEPLATTTVGEGVARGLKLLLGAVALLLLVACSNVAHLFLARGIGRAQEMSVRRALGASTRALVGQLAAESAVVGAAAGAVGLALAWVTLRGFGRWTTALPRGDAITMDLRVLAFALVLSSGTVLVFGLIPALRSTRGDLHRALRSSARGASSSRAVQALRSGLVIGEVAVSLVLVTLAGLLMRSFVEVARQETGIVSEDVVVVPLTVTEFETGDAYVQMMTSITDAVRQVTGVESATWSAELPFENVGGNSCCWAMRIQLTEDDEPTRLAGHSVDAAFFETFGTEIVAGRSFLPGEAEPVVVVGERTAIRGWGSAQGALGEMLRARGEDRRIIGVAEHTLHYGLDVTHDITAYIPAWQNAFPIPWGSIAVKTRGDASGMHPQLREAIWSVAPELPIPTVTTLDAMIDESTSTRRFGGLLATSFGVLALLLAAGGLYGTLLYAVGEQRRAIGIRIALGAGRHRIERAVVGRAVLLGVGGIALGIAVSWWVTRFLESFLFGIPPRDAASLIGAAVVLMAVTAVAAWIPARNAANTDPLETLRVE
jgi:predicted permease